VLVKVVVVVPERVEVVEVDLVRVITRRLFPKSLPIVEWNHMLISVG
jgi:hypothetical protein